MIPKLSSLALKALHKTEAWVETWPRHSSGLDLSGDRAVEWSFAYAHMPAPSVTASALDFGSSNSDVPLVLARRGYEVVALDLLEVEVPWTHPRVNHVCGDLLSREIQSLRDKRFDLITNISSVEHVGLAGRYGVTQAREDGDLVAMELLRDLLVEGGRMILTVPVGRDFVFEPLHRVYGHDRLPKLLEGLDVVHEEYWSKNPENRWISVEQSGALATPPKSGDAPLYSLGCFLLEKL